MKVSFSLISQREGLSTFRSPSEKPLESSHDVTNVSIYKIVGRLYPQSGKWFKPRRSTHLQKEDIQDIDWESEKLS